MLKSRESMVLRLARRVIPMPTRKWLKSRMHAGISARLLVHFRHGFLEVEPLLKHIKLNGFSPETIIDGGAFVGDWSRAASRIFPQARFVMVEANEEKREQLAVATKQIANSEYVIALLGPETKPEVAFHVLEMGSSVLPELTSFSTTTRRLPMTRLDDLLDRRQSSGQILLKLDVQGFELEVLRGASLALAISEVVILEVSLLPYNQGAPSFLEVMSFMANSGFVIYDFCGQARRESDNALFQADVVFVKDNSQLRAKKKFWLRED